MADRSFRSAGVAGLPLRSHRPRRTSKCGCPEDPAGQARSADDVAQSDQGFDPQGCREGGGHPSIESEPHGLQKQDEPCGRLVNSTMTDVNSTEGELPAVGEVASFLYKDESGNVSVEACAKALAAIGGELYVRTRAYCPSLARWKPAEGLSSSAD